jgi:hypothetical protein
VSILDKPPEMIVLRKRIPVTMVPVNAIVLSPVAFFIWTTVIPKKTAAAMEINLWPVNKALLYGFPELLRKNPVVIIKANNSIAPIILKVVIFISPHISVCTGNYSFKNTIY